MNKIICTALISLCLLLLSGYSVAAQDSVHTAAKPGNKDWVAIGVGTGLDYGGALGFKFAPQVSPNLGLFVGVGFWDSHLTANAGFKIRVLPKPQSSISPYLMLLYGSNELVSGRFNSIISKGISSGAGIDLFNRPNSFGYISLGANYAIAPSLLYFTIGLNAIMVKGK